MIAMLTVAPGESLVETLFFSHQDVNGLRLSVFFLVRIPRRERVGGASGLSRQEI